jgi:nucleoside-diphosphate-sugar epimerase
MKNFLVLGASSSVGANLVYILKKSKVDGLIRKPIKLHSQVKQKRLNLIKNKLICLKQNKIKELKKYQNVINCIGLSKNFNSLNYNFQDNKKKFLNYSKYIINIIKVTQCKTFIHIGSSMEYGTANVKFGQVFTENSKTFPKSKYGKFKLFESNFFKKELKKTNTRLVILRLFSIYGSLVKKNSLMCKILSKKNFY